MSKNGSFQLNTTPLSTVLALHSAVCWNDKVIVLGGTTAGTATAAGGIGTISVSSINGDGSMTAFKTAGNLPAARSLCSSDVTDDGFIYTIGGQDTSGVAQANVYLTDMSNDGTVVVSSRALSTFPKATMTGHCVVVDNNLDNIYVIGGGAATQTDVYYASMNDDGTLTAWAKTIPHPVDISFTAGFVYNGYLYTTGGLKVTGSVVQTACYRAKINNDGTLQSWGKLNDLNTPRHRHAAFVQNGRAYVVGGAQTTVATNAIASKELAQVNGDGSLSNWTPTGPLTQNIRNCQTLVANGLYVYTVGGFDGTNGLSSVHKGVLQHDGHI